MRPRVRARAEAVWAILGIGVVVLAWAGCADDADAPEAPVTTVPASCLDEPSFDAAKAKALAQLGERAGEPLDARTTHIPAVTAASALGRADFYDQVTSALVTDIGRLADTLESAFQFPTDPAKEALVLVSYIRAESTIELRRAGDVVHVYVVRTRPCVDDQSAEATAREGRAVLVAAVPIEIASVELHVAEERFRPALPTPASDGCRREGVAFHGGGAPGLLPGTPHTLFVNGFSAMTGNVFAITSNDGATWTPSGWAEEALLAFEDRGPYAEVYGPTPIRLGSTLYLYASALTRPPLQKESFVRFAQIEGNRFAAAEEVRLLPESGWEDGVPFAPSLRDRDGTISMYYVGKGRDSARGGIGLATSVDAGKTFTREGDGPLVGPETFPYPVSRVSEPHVQLVGERFEMWCKVALSGGDPTAELVSALAHLTSSDGRAWTADPEPLVVPRGDAERGGLTAPAALVEPNRITLFATAINGRSEPAIERFVCPRK